jgi:Alginate lyase
MKTGFDSCLRHRPAIRAAWFASCLFGVALAQASFAAGDTNNTARDAAASAGSAGGFRHPGVLLNRPQLELIKRRVAAGIEPQKSAFEAARSSNLGALSYTPRPWQTCECGPRSNPDRGCKDEQRDSEAAYTQALLWFITGDSAYAENAVKIMNAWSSTLTGGHQLANGPVQAAWCAEVWPRAAEIIRCTYSNWPAADVAQFQRMLATQYVPSIIGGSCENGNKELSMSEALINIGVFNDDRAIFEAGLRMWRGRAPAYIYLSTDGPSPIQPAGCDMAIWGNKGITTPLVDGLLQETVRDSGHANMALAAMVNAAETARQQGVDLYAEQADRIMAALEYQAQFLPPNHAPVPDHLAFNKHPTWEIAYNHYHNRLGHKLPRMAAVLPTNRPTGVNHHMVWETLTHGDVGDVGLPPVTTPSP